MIISGIIGVRAPNIISEIPLPDFSQQIVKEEKETIEKTITVEEYVTNYFSDIPIMAKVAKCESRFRQYDKDGFVLRGEINSLDRGVMQINEYYHLNEAIERGFDIYSIEGNAAYARDLYERQGLRPWKSSSKCWGGYLGNEIAFNR